MFSRKRSITPVALSFVVGPLLIGMVAVSGGCGGGNTAVQTVPLTTEDYAGQVYNGRVVLPDGAIGMVGLSTGRENQVRTIWSITSASGTTTPLLSAERGSFEPADGRFTANGYVTSGSTSYATLQISGTLPRPPVNTGGTITVSFGPGAFGGGTYTGSFVSASPTPARSPNSTPE